ncbi:MAG: hypothetical protein WBF53_00620 [Litorimonas sp.]
MSDDEPLPPQPARMGPVAYAMRRVVGPAGAVVVLYASIRALPPLLMNQVPPIDGGDLFNVFAASLVGFGLLAAWLDWRAAKREGER